MAKKVGYKNSSDFINGKTDASIEDFCAHFRKDLQTTEH